MRIDENEDRTVLVVAGPIRLGEVPQWLDLAQRAAARGLPVEIDLFAAEHLHAAAWQVLCALARELESAGLRFKVTRLSPVALAGCALIGLSHVLGVGEAA